MKKAIAGKTLFINIHTLIRFWRGPSLELLSVSLLGETGSGSQLGIQINDIYTRIYDNPVSLMSSMDASCLDPFHGAQNTAGLFRANTFLYSPKSIQGLI